MLWGKLGLAFLTVAVVVIAVTGKYESARRKYQGECQSKVSRILAANPKKDQAGSDECKDAKEYMPWGYILVAWPEGLGAWVVILTLIGIFWQSNETTKSAEAALKQAAATAASQRAWLVIRSSMDGQVPGLTEDPLFFWWTVKNTGNTPAQVVETQCKYEMVQSHNLYELPDTPPDPLPIDLKTSLLAPGDTMDFSTFLRDEKGLVITPPLGADDLLTLRTEMYILRAFGYVKYLDGISKEERESRFCDYYVWPADGRSQRLAGFRRLIGIPSAYRKCT
jgi:hypothetical protein